MCKIQEDSYFQPRSERIYQQAAIMKEVYVTRIFNAVLGQFCAEVITLAFARTQKALLEM